MNRPFERQVDSTPTLRHQRFQLAHTSRRRAWPVAGATFGGDFWRLQETKHSRADAKRAERSSNFLNGRSSGLIPQRRYAARAQGPQHLLRKAVQDGRMD
jgi:hypothetical protein